MLLTEDHQGSLHEPLRRVSLIDAQARNALVQLHANLSTGVFL
jgi:hypothetical protein